MDAQVKTLYCGREWSGPSLVLPTRLIAMAMTKMTMMPVVKM